MTTREFSPNKATLLALLLLLGGVGVVASQQTTQSPNSPMMPSHQMMMDRHQAMTEQMAAAQTRLDSLLADLDSATGKTRIDALIAVVRELANEQHTMRGQMMAMEPEMMQHMASHMMAGMHGMHGEAGTMMHNMMGSMAQCPMVQGSTSGSMPAPDEGGASQHLQHHSGR